MPCFWPCSYFLYEQASGVELRHLRYFIAVAKHGSFNRAAHALHLTQPALSRQVKDLEEELAVPLLARGKNTVTLTEAGEQFYEEAREIIARAELAVQRLRNEPRAEVLRIGYAPSATAGILPRALEKFHAAHPRTRVELADLFPKEMSRMARDGELDVVITLDSFERETPNFQWEEFRRMSLALVMRADHALAKRKRVSPQDLQSLPLVGLHRETFPEYLPHIRKILKSRGITPKFVALERDGVSTMFATLEAYNAAAIVADSAATSLPKSLVSRPFFPAFDPIIAKIGWPANNPKPHVRAFVDLFRKAEPRRSRRR